jgi:hypothetical protein
MRVGIEARRQSRASRMQGAYTEAAGELQCLDQYRNPNTYKPAPAKKKKTYKRSLFSIAIASRLRASDAG